jgi:hypothetical protein
MNGLIFSKIVSHYLQLKKTSLMDEHAIYNGRTYDKVLYHCENLIFNKLSYCVSTTDPDNFPRTTIY